MELVAHTPAWYDPHKVERAGGNWPRSGAKRAERKFGTMCGFCDPMSSATGGAMCFLLYHMDSNVAVFHNGRLDLEQARYTFRQCCTHSHFPNKPHMPASHVSVSAPQNYCCLFVGSSKGLQCSMTVPFTFCRPWKGVPRPPLDPKKDGPTGQDQEDLYAYNTFFHGIQGGSYLEASGRDHLWCMRGR